MTDYLRLADTVPGWRSGDEAAAVFNASYSLPADCIIVEVGVFLGRGTILLAGARKLRGSGKVHCIDPFDCSGDDYSVPFYRQITEQGDGSMRVQFDEHLQRAGLTDWVEVHSARAADAAMNWHHAVDLLLLDGDQSQDGAWESYERRIPHLKQGGILILCNSTPREYAETHDGNYRIARTEIAAPKFVNVRQVGTATIAVKGI